MYIYIYNIKNDIRTAETLSKAVLSAETVSITLLGDKVLSVSQRKHSHLAHCLKLFCTF